ncbi:hypothetical protein K501DRAFT_225876, partial [Backusella circina FSU 941]
MKLILSALFLCISTLVFGQQQVTTGNSSTISAIISQYGDSFKSLGGSVLSGKVNVYIVFYGNWTQLATEQSVFMEFIDTISDTPWFATLKQYNSNSKEVTGPLHLSAAVNDIGSIGLNLTTNDQHKEIITGAIKSGYLSATNTINDDGIYIVMGGPDVQDSQFCNTHCGYNSFGDNFQYIFMGYPGNCADKCIPSVNLNSSPNNSPSIDAAITILSHEIQDILTDPRNDAWKVQTDNQTLELGDFCSSEGTSQEQFGNVTQGTSGSYNLEVGDYKYLVQTIFDLSSKTCILGVKQ